MIHGIDISHHNNPNWEELDYVRFAMIRATMGASGNDKKLFQHSIDANAHAVNIGYYHLFRPEHPWRKQVEHFSVETSAIGYGRANHICPAIDVETVSTGSPNPDWAEPLSAMLDWMGRYYGGVYLYCNPNDWKKLGKPGLPPHYVWRAHWGREPLSVDIPSFGIHQYAVSKPGLPAKHESPRAGLIDHNAAVVLPTLG